MKNVLIFGIVSTGVASVISSLSVLKLINHMASIEEFKAVTARIEAAADKIIANQGISKAQEDELLGTLTEQAEELEASAEGGLVVPPQQPGEEDLPALPAE